MIKIVLQPVMRKRKQEAEAAGSTKFADAEAIFDFLWKQEAHAEARLKHCFRFRFAWRPVLPGFHIKCGLLISCIVDVNYQ